MYVIGQGQDISGPGTSMVQRINWNRASETQLNQAAGLGGCRGMGCAGMKGCGCAGLGLFDSGMDFSGWGTPEFAIAGLAIYMVISTLTTTARGARTVGRTIAGAGRGAASGAREGGGRRSRGGRKSY